MTLLLVRHAAALRRSDWHKPDDQRPLSPRGLAQADALAVLLRSYGVERILSSPAIRCVETVQPLAARLALPVEELPELAEGAGVRAVSMLRDVGLSSICVACTHGDVLPQLLEVLAPEVDVGGDEFRCAKGSTWVLLDGGPVYLPPST